MRYTVILLLCFLTVANADIANQFNKSKSEQKTLRNSNQTSLQKSYTNSKTKIKGKEKTNSKTISKTISKIKSTNHTVSKTKTGNWDIVVNPIPIILKELRALGWNKKAFYLSNSDIKTSYYIGNDEDIIDMNAKSFYEAKAQMKGKTDEEQRKRIENYINLLLYTSKMITYTVKELKTFPDTTISNFDKRVKFAILKAYNKLKRESFRSVNIHDCHFAGNLNSYTCNYGEYTLSLTNALPNLYINGALYYSATSTGFTTPSLKISFAKSTNDALTKLTQNQSSRVVANIIRDYTNKLQQRGYNDIATKIKNKFIEKTINEGTTTSATAVVNAINSGSPLAVLKIFK